MLELERWSTGSGSGPLSAPPEPSPEALVPRMLVIDDDPEIHRLLRARLEALGYHVSFASSGEEGLNTLRDVNPDVVFLDVAMSGMTGIDVLDFVRSQPLDVAVILTTAYSSEGVAIAALRHGADDYLRKPFDRSEFQATLDRTLARLTMSRQIKLLRRELEKKQAQLAREIARAAVVQSELLPTEQPPLSGFEIGARCIPASAVGGDFYDWQQLPAARFSLTVGDVMGKGMSAALLMATVRAVIRAMAWQHEPAAAVQHTATSLDGDLARSGSFATLFHAQLDVTTAELGYVDAGHSHVLLRRADGSIESLLPCGLPIGVASNERYREGRVTLEHGDLLVIYSDGLTAARPDLFRDQATLAAEIPPDEHATATAQRLVELATETGPLADDLTVVALRRPFAA
jgi:sigma-B regulation protein RsbU (phosphoserine phosphatase)